MLRTSLSSGALRAGTFWEHLFRARRRSASSACDRGLAPLFGCTGIHMGAWADWVGLTLASFVRKQ